MRSLDCEVKTKAATGNGASGIPRAEANATKDARRLRRTLFFAGVFALLAMIYVPAPAPRPGWAAHYRFIFSQHETGIAFFQLLVNVVFAAIIGALAANLSRRIVLWAARIVVVIAIILAASLGFDAFQYQMKTGAEREAGIANGAIINGKFDVAKEHLVKASNYWWWKGWWDGGRKAREHAADEAWMKKAFQEASVAAAQGYENHVREIFRLALSLNRYPTDYEVTQAKQLLLIAAEKWDTVGNPAEAERVRAWEQRIKTEAEFRGAMP